jgi:small GTP-binding protein
VNLLKKELEVEQYGLTHAQIWDLGGQDSFGSVRKIYLDGSKGALLIYDMTRKETFDALDFWIGSFKEIRGNDGDIILIGNKSDLKDQIVVSHEDASEYAKEMGLDYIVTSAKSGDNVEEAFLSLFKKILDRYSKES